MENVKAYYTHAPSGGIDFKSVKVNEVGNVKIRPLLTGICGTDRGVVNGSLSFAYNPDGYNFLVIGHESLCEVIESESEQFKSGDLVVPLVRRPGNCPNCLIGRPDNCSDGNKHEAGITGLHGFMREEFKDYDYNLVKVSDRSLGDIGVLTEPTKNVVKAFEVFERISTRCIYNNSSSTLEGKKALIIGTGSEAFLYSLLSRDYGFETYIMNRHPIEKNKMDMCQAFGVNFLCSAEKGGVLEKLSIDLLIDTSGDPGTVFNYMKRLNYNGIAILFGTNEKAPNATITGADIDFIVERNITMAGSVDAARVHYIKALDYLSKWHRKYGDILKDMITGYYKPGNLEQFMKKPDGEIKSVIRW